jgi:VIT1/CCC1 family predicted Fe2+/Mn2+ transporter
MSQTSAPPLPSLARQAGLGFLAAALSVLTFHQAMWAVFYAAGAMPLAPYPMLPTQPFGVPLILSLCFWGGLYGAVFGLLLPRLRPPYWVRGLVLGLIAALVGMFVVAPLKGQPFAAGWAVLPWIRSLLINGCWGVGVGLIAPLFLRPSPR